MFTLYRLEKQLRRDHRSGEIEPDVEKYVGLGIDRGEEPVLLLIDRDHGFIERDILGITAVPRFEPGLLHPVVDGRLTTVDAEII